MASFTVHEHLIVTLRATRRTCKTASRYAFAWAAFRVHDPQLPLSFVQLSISCPSKRVVIWWPPRSPAKAVHPTGSGTDSKTRHLVTCLQNSPRPCQQKRPFDLFGRRLDEASLRHGMRPIMSGRSKPVVAVTVRGFTGLPRLGHLRMVRGPSTPVRGRDGEQCSDCQSSRRAKR